MEKKMLGEAEKIIIGGFTTEKVNGKRIIKSVYIKDAEDRGYIEVPISEYYKIDKKKLAKEILKYYRKEVTVILDLRNDIHRKDRHHAELRFVGIKKDNLI